MGTALKWIGGVTAVISLVIGAVRVNEVYEGWRERRETVAELVQASRLQLEARDYEGGWTLLQQALALDPAARSARAFQIDLAMEWLRNIRVSGGTPFGQIVDRLLPVLYRGTAKADSAYAGDVFAHIGWANYLKVRDTRRPYAVDAQYLRALEIDPDNTYAHIHRAHWLLNALNESADDRTRLETAKGHIAAALASGRQLEYTADLALRALLDSSVEGASREALQLANELRKSGLTLEKRLVSDLLQRIWHPGRSSYLSEGELAVLTSAIAPAEMLATFHWILAALDAKESDRHGYLFVVARLTEAAGNEEAALSLYRSLRSDERIGSIHQDAIDVAIKRLTSKADSQ